MKRFLRYLAQELSSISYFGFGFTETIIQLGIFWPMIVVFPVFVFWTVYAIAAVMDIGLNIRPISKAPC